MTGGLPLAMLGFVTMRFRQQIGIAGTALAAATAGAPAMNAAPTITASVTAVSDYLFRGQRLSGASLQPAVQLAAGGFSGAVTGNFAIEDRGDGAGDSEVDLFASQRFALPRGASLEPGLAIYRYDGSPAKLPGYRKTVVEPSLAVHFPAGPVRITPAIYYDLTRRGPTGELAAAIALPLARLGTELDLTATAGRYRLRDALTTGGRDTKLEGDYWSFDVTVPVQVAATSRIAIGITYAAGSNSHLQPSGGPRVPNPLVRRRGIVHASYSRTF